MCVCQCLCETCRGRDTKVCQGPSFTSRAQGMPHNWRCCTCVSGCRSRCPECCLEDRLKVLLQGPGFHDFSLRPAAHILSHGFVLQLSFTNRRGFFLVAPRPGLKVKGGGTNPELPRSFLPLEGSNKGPSVACTTHELNALNARLRDATNDCLLLIAQVSLSCGATSSVCPCPTGYLTVRHANSPPIVLAALLCRRVRL
jgi:hypothetical protein